VDERTVVMNSFVEYSVDGGPKRFCQLVHPSPLTPSYGLSVATLEGAGLIGMRSGQTMLWPNLQGSLRDLQVLKVERSPRRSPLETEI
jgi:regulator of nucleoside diphosphate kinase